MTTMTTLTKLTGDRFPLGRTLTTPGALAAVGHAAITRALRLHSGGYWGDLPPEDAAANERALREGDRILSSYHWPGGRFWIITEADHSATTVLLPEEY